MQKIIIRSLSLLLAVSLFYCYGTDGAASEIKKTGKPKYKEGELLVKFKPGVSANKKDSLHWKHGSKKVKEFVQLRIQHIKLKKDLSVDQAIALYNVDPDVEYAEPDYELNALNTPNDPYFDSLWGLHNIGQTGGTADADIDAPEAWDVVTGNHDVTVAVIDTGVDYNHEDLSANKWVNLGEISADGIDNDGNGYTDDIHGIDTCNADSDPMDDHGHGTHVSGTIGADGNNSIGVAGVNWNVKIMACKFLDSSGSGYTSGAIECLQYVKMMKDRGVNIIATNNSWGGGEYSQALYDAINAQRDILFIAAAGNASSDNDVIENVPSNYFLPNVLAVAATDYTDALASFSNYGRKTVHIGAPGVDIVSLRAAGTDMYGDGRHFIPDGDPDAKYYSSNGTSMAAPHVSGLAALIKSDDIGRDWRAVKNLILSGGNLTTAMNDSTITGRRINAYGSLTCANKPVFSILEYPQSVTVGQPETISALSINCADPAGPVTAETSDGTVITLLDDGISPDLATGDGIFTGIWIPARNIEKLTFDSPGGTEVIIIPPLSVTTAYLATRPIGVPYSQTLTAAGGLPPYTWSIVSGSLPPGLTLNSSTGEISGTPTTSGKYSVTVLATESYQSTSTKDLSITIYNENSLDQLWTKTYNSSGGSALAVAADESGNVYVAGITLDSYVDYLTVKYDSSGNVLWAHTYGGGYEDFASGLALDGSGNLYVTGYSHNGTNYDVLTIKYDPAGNTLWSQIYDSGIDDYADGIAIDGSGFVYLTGSTFAGPRSNQNNMLTLKYDTGGTLLWNKSFGRAQHGDQALDIAIDSSNNIYMTGVSWNRTNPGDFITVKADQDGNELWTVIYDGGDEDYAKGVAVDASGNVYVTGSSFNGQDYDYLTLKYNSLGETLWNRNYSGNGHDYAEDIALYGNDIYVTGASSNGVNFDAVTVKYSMAGVDKGLEIYDSGQDDYSYAIAPDGIGNIYVAGHNDDFLLIKYMDYCSIVTTSLPNAAVNTFYSQTLTVVGGMPPYTWSVTTGSLPPGLALNSSTGEISGIPTAEGTFDFTVQVADSDFHTAARDLSVTVSLIGINPAALPFGTTGVVYSETLSASGGQPPYTWSISSGSLPPGLVLENSTGVISGAPTATGTYAFTVRATDSHAMSDTWAFTLVIYDPLIITTASLPSVIIGDAYNATLIASGGITPYTWSVISGSFPAGLALNNATGEISGIPTAQGVFDFTVKVTDDNAVMDTADLSISVNDTAMIITTSSLPDGTTGTAYSAALSVSDGLPPYTWSLISGSLPPGMVLAGLTGEILGTPHTVGTYVFTIQVMDAREATTVADLTIIVGPYAVWSAVHSGPYNEYARAVALDDLGNAYVTGYSNPSYPANADLLTVKYDPAGNEVWVKSYDTGTWDYGRDVALDSLGNIYVAGNSGNRYSIVKYSESGDILWTRIYDNPSSSDYGQAVAIDESDNIYVAGHFCTGSGVCDCLTLKYDSSGTLLWSRIFNNQDYDTCSDVAIDSSGNAYIIGSELVKYDSSGNLLWSAGHSGSQIAAGEDDTMYVLTFGELYKVDPSGNKIWTGAITNSDASEAGAIASDLQGNAYVAWHENFGTQGGDFDFYMEKYDAGGARQWRQTHDVTDYDFARAIAVNASGEICVTGHASPSSYNTWLTVKFREREPLEVTTEALIFGTVETPYSQTLSADGGLPPHSWSIASGSLPPGLALNSTTGEIAGTPTLTGSFTFTVRVTDADAAVADKPLSITIYSTSLTIVTSSLPAGSTGLPYSRMLSATGGLPPYSWSISSGSLPPGLALNSTTGEIAGTPTSTGTSFSFTARVTDAEYNSGTRDFSISIYDPLNIADSSLPYGVEGTSYGIMLSATGGLPPYSWSIAGGSLPVGLALKGSTGELSGTPVQTGTYNFTVRATDANATTTDKALSIIVYTTVTITKFSLNTATSCIAYSQTVTAEGGPLPYEWMIVSGSLPPGLALNSTTGEIAGTPTAAGTNHYFTIRVTDDASNSNERPFNIALWYKIRLSQIAYTGSLQSTYYNLSHGGTLMLTAMTAMENLAFISAKAVTIKGGYDCDFTANPSYTTIVGTLTNDAGTAALEKIILTGTLTVNGGTVIPKDVVLK